MASAIWNVFGVYSVILFAMARITVVFGVINMEITPLGDVLNIPVGTDRSLTCVVNGINVSAPLTNLEWKDPKNNVLTRRNNRIRPVYVSNNIVLLLLTQLETRDGGVYTCSATYNGETLFASVKVIPYQISFVNAPVNQLAESGSTYKIKCRVEADPQAIVEWTKNNETIRNGSRYTQEHDGLVINDVNESDNGEYHCIGSVAEIGETKSRIINLEVVRAPKIVNTTDHFATEGGNATLICQATGKPKPDIIWVRKSGRQVVAKETNGVLRIEKISKGENYDYFCQAVNKAGEDEIHVHLNVN